MKRFIALLSLLICGCIDESHTYHYEVKFIKPDGSVHKTQKISTINRHIHKSTTYAGNVCIVDEWMDNDWEDDTVAPIGWDLSFELKSMSNND